MAPRILVLGAGINGMSSAVCVQHAFPQAPVEIVSEFFTPNTTSDISAGFWRPHLVGNGDTERSLRFSSETFEYLMDLAGSSLASISGVQRLSGYTLYKNCSEEEAEWQNVLDDYKHLTKRELVRFPMADKGDFYTTVSVDVPRYLDWLMDRFRSKGGILRQEKVDSLEQIAGSCDLLINCSALSSRYLFNDEKIYPVRGQVWKVHAPWLKHFYRVQDGNKTAIYVFPGVDYTTIGGTTQKGDWNTDVDPKDSALIWDRAVSALPWLKGIKPVKSVVGLRPCRDSIRVEAETISVDGKKLKVVHNYGQGGSGITMHWGCATEVSKLALQVVGSKRATGGQIVGSKRATGGRHIVSRL